MTRYEIAHAGEEEKIVNFGNYIFSQSARPHDFRAMLPKVYKKGVPNARMHYVAHDEDGDIRAMVCALPLQMQICGLPLKVGTVGTVSVHPYARGEGHMKHVMALMEEDCRKQNMDALVLGGLRQRYNHFGFEYAGANLLFTMHKENLRYSLADADTAPFSFVRVTDNDDPLCEQCFALYEQGAVHGARPRAQYLDYAHSWYGELYAILKNGEFAGALIENGEKIRNIGEILLVDESDLKPVLKKWMQNNPQTTAPQLTVWPFEHERIRTMEAVSEHMEIIPCQMLYVLNFENTLRALMKLNALCRTLQNGEAVLKIGEEQLLLSVKDGETACEKTDKTPDLTLTPMEAQRLLFLPTRLLLNDTPVLKNWLPLPWVMPSPDHF